MSIVQIFSRLMLEGFKKVLTEQDVIKFDNHLTIVFIGTLAFFKAESLGMDLLYSDRWVSKNGTTNVLFYERHTHQVSVEAELYLAGSYPSLKPSYCPR